MRSGRCPPHDADNDARRTRASLLVDLEVHQRVIMRIPRHADVSMTLKACANARADGDARSAAQAEGSPFGAQVNSRLRCCTCRFFAAVLASREALTNFGKGSDAKIPLRQGLFGYPVGSSVTV